MPFHKALWVAVPLFITGLIAGLISSPDWLDYFGSLQQISDTLANATPLSLFLFILFNNAVTLLFAFALSPVLCLAPILSLFVNGWVIGLVSVAVYHQESLLFVLAGILPHGIIEIPALLISQAAAIGFGSSLLLYVFQRSSRDRMIPRIRQNAIYFGIAMLMLPAAAVIEAFVTPLILSHI